MIKVGQILWWVANHGVNKEVTVLKVGRKWAELNNGQRIDLSTLVADAKGYTPAGVCHLDRGAWENQQAKVCHWQAIRRSMGYQPPATVSLDDILTAKRLLGLCNQPPNFLSSDALARLLGDTTG